MPFSPSVRREVLIRAARHCCVCHRYKGVRVEVHHIVPQAQGGSDDLDNAIALCFDCHADAGHYNPNHPRGIRFSPQELREARDRWYMMITGNRIQSPETEEWIYIRYLVSKSFSALAEIVEGDLHQIPVPHPLLVQNAPLIFMRTLVMRQGNTARTSRVYGNCFPDDAAYRMTHPDVRMFERSQYPYYPYFRTFRLPSEREIRDRVVPSDPLSGVLLDAGADPRDVCWALGYDELCGGGGGFQELYRVRDLWCVFLELRNVSGKQIRLRNFACIADQESERYRQFTTLRGEKAVFELPAGPILPDHSVLIPVAVLLAPLDCQPPLAFWTESAELAHGQYQELDHVDYSSLARAIGVLGPALWPSGAAAIVDDRDITQDIHDLDLSNLYTLDRYWAAGSCPHLFFQNISGGFSYIGEVFSRAPYLVQTHSIEIPEGIIGVVLTELEHEETNLVMLKLNGKTILSERRLSLGESVAVGARPGDVVILRGGYAPRIIARQDPLFQNRRVWEFMQRAPKI